MIQTSSYLYRKPCSGIYYTRLVIPVVLRHRYGKTCIKQSLKTKDLRLASALSAQIVYHYKKEFETLKAMGKKDDQSSGFGLISLELWDGTKATIEQDDPDEEVRQAKQLLDAVKSPSNQSYKSSSDSAPVPVAEIIDNYCEEKNVGGSWTGQTDQEYRSIYATFLEIVGETITADQLDFTVARQYKELILKLPPNFKKSPKFDGLSIPQILAKGFDPMSVRSMNKYLSAVSSLMGWAMRQGYIERNYFDQLTIKATSNISEERLPFDQSDLDKLLEYPKKPLRDYYHWLPLLGYYTGARLEELCSLYLDDIYLEDGIWILDINKNTEDKHVKTDSSLRKIPIHQSLIELDFLAFVEKQKSKGHDRLFSDLKYQNRKYGKAASKWFKRYRDRQSVGEARKAFHSFRHTFSERLKVAGVEPHFIAALLGHKDETITTGRYGSGQWPLSDLHKSINRLPHHKA